MMKRKCYSRQTGLSLVELLIGMVLGLIVVSAVFNMYLGSSRSARFSDGLQTMQDNGRYGISVLQRGLRLAGYNSNESLEPFDIAAGDDSTIVVRSRQEFDCNGQSTAPTDGIAVNTYTHDAVNLQLTCEGNSALAAPMSVVEGVDAFRLLYGVDANGDDVPETYVPYDASLDPYSISSIRFALLVNSGGAIRSRKLSQTHVLFDTSVVTDDQIARNVFSNTVKLRNGF